VELRTGNSRYPECYAQSLKVVFGARLPDPRQPWMWLRGNTVVATVGLMTFVRDQI